MYRRHRAPRHRRRLRPRQSPVPIKAHPAARRRPAVIRLSRQRPLPAREPQPPIPARRSDRRPPRSRLPHRPPPPVHRSQQPARQHSPAYRHPLRSRPDKPYPDRPRLDRPCRDRPLRPLRPPEASKGPHLPAHRRRVRHPHRAPSRRQRDKPLHLPPISQPGHPPPPLHQAAQHHRRLNPQPPCLPAQPPLQGPQAPER